MGSAEQGSKSYVELAGLAREAAVLGSAANTLAWDQETMMPPAAAPLRADQLSALSAIVHERWTSPRIGELLSACADEAALRDDPDASANIREWKRDYDRARKVPTALVAEFAKTTSEAMEAWKHARASSKYTDFAPWLEKVVTLCKRKAECWGPPSAPAGGGKTTLYDALLDEFEPGMTEAQIEALFNPLRTRLTPLIASIAQAVAKKPVDESIHAVRVPLEQQKAFNGMVAMRLGFDTTGGRLDESAHPFSDGAGPGDTRMTTRYRHDHFMDALSSTLHETGHSLYEQGLDKWNRFGQPLAQAASLGIHESQSRMWENFVGRSRAFWEWALPEAKKVFAPALDKHSVEQAHRAANSVKPNFIRVDSDEATYNLHIMLRFDLERALFTGDLSVRDLPGAWNERIKKDLGLEVKEDRLGCLQDVHWSMGAIGYFPTYTLGNLYAGQMWGRITRDLPDLEIDVARGNFAPLLGWLREHVHTPGRRWSAPELCKRITGSALSHEPLMEVLDGKLKPLYGV